VDAWARGKNGAAAPARMLYPPGDWDYVTTVPARGESLYSYVAPTLCDSTSEGICWSVFFVSALTPDPLVYFDSAPDSGYSVDNLAPEAPHGLVAEAGAGRIILAWDANEEEDLDYYAVYRDTVADFTPEEPIGHATTPAYEDASMPGPDAYWYKVTALDFGGNESEPSLAAGLATAVTEAERPGEATFSLAPAAPSPAPGTARIAYTIPAHQPAAPVSLDLYDSRGRRVRRLVHAEQPGGAYSVSWDGRDATGAEVPSGVYFYRLEWRGESLAGRLVLVR